MWLPELRDVRTTVTNVGMVAMSEQGALLLEEPIDVKLHAPPDTIRTLLKETADEIRLDKTERFRVDEIKHNNGTALSVRADLTNGSAQIGLIFLLALVDDRTLLRVPRWRGRFELDPDGRLFSRYLQAALQEMQRLEFMTGRGRFNSVSVIDSAIQSLASAEDPSGYAAVGSMCRSALIALANEIYQPHMRPPEVPEPKGDDARSKLRQTARHCGAGMRGRQDEGFQKVIDGTWTFGPALAHRKNAKRQDAEVCVALVTSVFDSFALMVPS